MAVLAWKRDEAPSGMGMHARTFGYTRLLLFFVSALAKMPARKGTFVREQRV